MTRAKAVDAAMREVAGDRETVFTTQQARVIQKAMERLADEMRIEGMREAARVKHELRNEKDSEVLYANDITMDWDKGHDAHIRAIRARILELSKKARKHDS